jgi:archaellum biogenesis ATPase FlaH
LSLQALSKYRNSANSSANQVIQSAQPERLPHNHEAEMLVLGSLIVDPDGTLSEVSTRLKPEDFFIRAHKILYESILAMHQQNMPIDSYTLLNVIRDANLLAEIGGHTYITQLTGIVTTTTSVVYYAEIVRKKSLLRLLIHVGQEIIDRSLEERRTPDEVFATALGELESVEALRTPLVARPYDYAQPNVKPKSSQVENLLRERDLVLWIGPEKQGKTTLLYQLCVCLASGREFLGHRVERPTRVTYLDFETEPEDLQYRIAQYERILTPYEFLLMKENLEVILLREELLRLDDEPSLRRGSPGHRLLKRLINEAKGEVLVLDPFQEFATDVNELDNQDVRKALKEIQRLTQGKTCIVVHHLRKADERSLLKINVDFRRWSDRVRGAQAFKGKADSVFGQSLVDDDDLGSILYLGAFGKRLTLDPIPIVDSEQTWVWKERLSDSSLKDAERTLGEKDLSLLKAIYQLVQVEPLRVSEIADRLPINICSRPTVYRRVPKLIRQGFLAEREDGKILPRTLKTDNLMEGS